MSIATIPVEEMESDLEATIQDIKFCQIALANGVTTYGAGYSVEDRLKRNRRIKATIETELQRRRDDSALSVHDVQEPKREKDGEILFY